MWNEILNYIKNLTGGRILLIMVCVLFLYSSWFGLPWKKI